MKKILYVLIIAVFCLLFTNLFKAEDLGTKIPGDSVRLLMSCYDTTIYPTLATPDSVYYYRYRDGAFYDSIGHTVPTAVKTGVIIKTYFADITLLGQYYVVGIVKNGGKWASKTFTYKVGFDSIMVRATDAMVLAVRDSAHLANASALAARDSAHANTIKILVNTDSIHTVHVETDALNGGTLFNPATTEVNVVSTDTFTTLLGNVNGNVGGNVTGSVASVTGKVTVVDSTAGDVSYIANNPNDYKATGFLTQALLESDTTYTHLRSVVDVVAKFLGATDGYYQILYPLGSANKDSVEIFNSADTKLGTIYYFHTGSIIDSLRFEKW